MYLTFNIKLFITILQHVTRRVRYKEMCIFYFQCKIHAGRIIVIEFGGSVHERCAYTRRKQSRNTVTFLFHSVWEYHYKGMQLCLRNIFIMWIVCNSGGTDLNSTSNISRIEIFAWGQTRTSRCTEPFSASFSVSLYSVRHI